MEQETKSKSRLEELREAIATSASAIESEFRRSANDWLSCFGSRVFVVETYLDSRKLKELVPPEQYREAMFRLERLKERLFELKRQYPDKDTVPPDEVKQELLHTLNVFGEG